MTRKLRAGILGLSILLFCCFAAEAQKADTIRVGEEQSGVTDTATIAGQTGNGTDTAGTGERVEPTVLRALPDSVVATWKNDKVFEYANDPEYWKKQEVKEDKSPTRGWLSRLLSSSFFEYFLYGLLAAVLIYAIVRIVLDNKLQLFYKAPKRIRNAEATESGEAMQDDLEGQLTHFIQTKDYRQAVRFLFLKALRLLSERGMIRYHRDGTNDEYWRQLAETPQGSSFRNLTSIYEKVWYGEFPLGDPLFVRLHQYFEDFYKTVRV